MYDKYINFLKEHNLYDQEVLDYISSRTRFVNYDIEDSKDFIGCFPIEEDGIVKDIRLCVPKMVDDITVSINIHEYVHLLDVYNNLNKKYKNNKYEEARPMAYEFLYLKNNNPEYLKYRIDRIKAGDDDVLKILVKFYESTEKLFKKSR